MKFFPGDRVSLPPYPVANPETSLPEIRLGTVQHAQYPRHGYILVQEDTRLNVNGDAETPKCAYWKPVDTVRPASAPWLDYPQPDPQEWNQRVANLKARKKARKKKVAKNVPVPVSSACP